METSQEDNQGYSQGGDTTCRSAESDYPVHRWSKRIPGVLIFFNMHAKVWSAEQFIIYFGDSFPVHIILTSTSITHSLPSQTQHVAPSLQY